MNWSFNMVLPWLAEPVHGAEFDGLDLRKVWKQHEGSLGPMVLAKAGWTWLSPVSVFISGDFQSC